MQEGGYGVSALRLLELILNIFEVSNPCIFSSCLETVLRTVLTLRPPAVEHCPVSRVGNVNPELLTKTPRWVPVMNWEKETCFPAMLFAGVIAYLKCFSSAL